MSRYEAVLEYIEDYWGQTAKTSARPGIRNIVMRFGQVKLPHATVSPNKDYFAGTQFYWDTYFTILGLLDMGHHELAKGMVDNLVVLYEKFGLVPARNSLTSLGRTQPPFLTRMAFEVYGSGAANQEWLDRIMKVALEEYETVWLSGKRYDPVTGMSLFRPKYLRRKLTVYESGWDLSSRFANPAQQVLPIDLNCQLYQYEADFLKWARLKDDKPAVARWRKAMKFRSEQIENCFWDPKSKFYYDNCDGRVGTLKTLAGFYPLWCGAASKERAKLCVAKLKTFEFKGGLANSQKLPLSNKQWNYPNGWAPQQLIVYEGLTRYGYKKEARRVAMKWLDCNKDVFERTGRLWEKYDVVKQDIGRSGRYPTQHGFAWTNGVFVRLHKLLGL